MKTLDINAKEWFDKVNGNSYFSAIVTVDFCLPTEKMVYIPFQYGYGEHYKTKAIEQLQKEGFLPNEGPISWSYFKDNSVVLRTSKKENCLKRDVKSWGTN